MNTRFRYLVLMFFAVGSLICATPDVKASTVTVTYSVGGPTLTVIGDPAAGALIIPASGVLMKDAELTQKVDSLNFTLTGIELDCPASTGQSGCGFGFGIQNLGNLNYDSGMSAESTINGYAVNTTLDGAKEIKNITSYWNLANASHQTIFITDTVINEFVLAPGSNSFSASSSVNKSQYAGPITEMTWNIGITISSGVDIFFPGSFDMVVSSPPSTVPEPTSLILLGTGIAGAVLTAWRRKKARNSPVGLSDGNGD